MMPFPRRLLVRVRAEHLGGPGYGGCVVLAALLASCSTMPPGPDEARLAEGPPRYSLVFLIHGDADYAYHDDLGKTHLADRETLAQAKTVAERNPDAEVFIFHEIARKHVLFLVPRHDGRAYYYRNGRLMVRESYWRDQGPSRFAPELGFYHRLAAGSPGARTRLFFYFGHELPESGGTGYDASSRERRVTIGDLAEAARDVAGGAGKVDLLGLATCFGGTPHTIGTLAPYARYIIASPDNLHLSSFDLAPLERLELGSGDGAVAAFADRFARNAFTRLEGAVQTAVSVVVYDTNAVGDFLDSATGVYDRALGLASDGSPSLFERCDCGDEPAYARPGMSRGLTVLYRAPHFGRLKHKASHSGWECWRPAE